MTTSEDPVWTTEQLGVRFGRTTALREVDLEIARGQVTVLLGPNGSGKSTLLRCAMGMLRPSAGSSQVFERDPITDADEIRQQVGYVPDRPDAPPWMKFKDLCRFLRGHYRTWDQRLVDELADRFDVPRSTKIGSMSKGQAMKTMLVLANGHRPPLLLLDEPFGGLDPISRDEVCAVVLTTLQSEDHTIVCCTHELELAARLADRVAILDSGRLVEHGTLADVFGSDEPTATPQRLKERLRQKESELTDRKEVSRC
ncbi:MAG: ABC transporter ATP-binding protein [Planctomycetota bacterium]